MHSLHTYICILSFVLCCVVVRVIFGIEASTPSSRYGGACVCALAGGGLIRRLDVEQQLEALPGSHGQWGHWMSEMFDHAEMVEQVCITVTWLHT